MKYYIGIAASKDNSAAVLIDEDGNIINMSREDKRTKSTNDWPEKSIEWCIRDAQAQGLPVKKDDIKFGFHERLTLTFLRRLYANPKDFSKHLDKIIESQKHIHKAKIIPYHNAHALGACSTAPFSDGIYLITDVLGEWDSTSWGRFNHNQGIKQDGKIKYPTSLGLLYMSFVRWLGLDPLKDIDVVIGASSFGVPKFAPHIMEEFVELKTNGAFKFKKNIYNGIEQYLGNDIIVDEWCNWAASIQKVAEDIMYHMLEMIEYKYGKNLNLVIGGSMANNYLINAKLLKYFDIDKLWILPNPDTTECAFGAAAGAAGLVKLNWKGPYLGADIDRHSQPTQMLIRHIVGRLERGEIVGWIQGREENSHNTLGHRSILCDPRRAELKEKIYKITNQNKFISLSASVVENNAFSYFDIEKKEIYRTGLVGAKIRNKELMPVLNHNDDLIKIQTIPKSTDSFSRLLEHWHRATDCAVLVNANFNINNNILISERQDALKILLNTPLDALVIGNRVYWKEEKVGLTEDGSPITVAQHHDFSQGADDIVS